MATRSNSKKTASSAKSDPRSQYIFPSDSENEVIDLDNTKPDIKVERLKTQSPDEFLIKISGKVVDYSVVNAIRRCVDQYVPIFGFHRSGVKIELDKTHCMYNFEMIYQQLETTPIFDLDAVNKFSLENPRTFLSNRVLRAIYNNFMPKDFREDGFDDSASLPKVEVYLNTRNSTDSDIDITTHDLVFKVNGEVQNSYKSRPPLTMLILKPNEDISLRAIANLGIAKIDAIYEAVTTPLHEMINTTTYLLKYNTQGQLKATTIFKRACMIMFLKLENLEKYLEATYPDDMNISEEVKLELYGEDYTLGYLVATTLQKCIYVESAGGVDPNPNDNLYVVAYRLFPSSKFKPIEVLVKVLNYLKRIFDAMANAKL
jgi:DNA-directed RNA polymerase subunit L